jgi:hypothetical protein
VDRGGIEAPRLHAGVGEAAARRSQTTFSACSGLPAPGRRIADAPIDHQRTRRVCRARQRVTVVSSNSPPGLAMARRWWPKKRR